VVNDQIEYLAKEVKPIKKWLKMCTIIYTYIYYTNYAIFFQIWEYAEKIKKICNETF